MASAVSDVWRSVVDKAKQINQEQKKLLQLMIEADEAEANTPRRSGTDSPAGANCACISTVATMKSTYT